MLLVLKKRLFSEPRIGRRAPTVNNLDTVKILTEGKMEKSSMRKF